MSTQTQKRPEWAEGVCEDGAAILRDGVMVTISEALACLNERERMLREREQVCVARDARMFELGWRTASDWAERDDLIFDIGSPCYIEDRDAAMAKVRQP